MADVAINPRDLTALVPDGPVNRHVQVTLMLDTESGAITGVYDLEYARAQARDALGNLPPEQLVGGPTTDPADIDSLREQIKQLRAELDASRPAAQPAPTGDGS